MNEENEVEEVIYWNKNSNDFEGSINDGEFIKVFKNNKLIRKIEIKDLVG